MAERKMIVNLHGMKRETGLRSPRIFVYYPPGYRRGVQVCTWLRICIPINWVSLSRSITSRRYSPELIKRYSIV